MSPASVTCCSSLPSGRLGFAPESLQTLRVSRDVRWQELQGNPAMKLRILRGVDFTHPAATDRLQDAVMQQRGANHAGAG
jgi:hypothetical protein